MIILYLKWIKLESWCYKLILSFTSSWRRGLAAACDCGAPWTFQLHFYETCTFMKSQTFYNCSVLVCDFSDDTVALNVCYVVIMQHKFQHHILMVSFLCHFYLKSFNLEVKVLSTHFKMLISMFNFWKIRLDL